MHIYEGILAATPHGQEVLLASTVAAAAGNALGLYKPDYERVPATAMLSSAVFVAPPGQVPLPPTSIHPVLSGLMGLVLGWSAFPAILVALLLQAVFFSVGGLTTLGLNTLIMALPAVACYYLFRLPACGTRLGMVFSAGFAAGTAAILFGALLSAVALMLAGKEFTQFANLFFYVHLPAAAIEGLITGEVVVLLRKVRPEVLRSPLLVPAVEEAFDG
jgi:cobalt/nickel transport system permease protein